MIKEKKLDLDLKQCTSPLAYLKLIIMVAHAIV